MALTQILAMIRKDLQVHYSDRRAVIMSFVAPIAIASFLGAITGGRGTPSEPARIPVAIVDQDGSAVTKAIVSGVNVSARVALLRARSSKRPETNS